MTEHLDRPENTALWRRWRASAEAAEPVPAPEAGLLAAYAEGRLSEAEAEPVEAWLAGHPERMEDVLVARGLSAHKPGATPAPNALTARAMALVDGNADVVVPFRRPDHPTPTWRMAVAWSSLAASLLVVSFLGFAMGNDAYLSLAGRSQSDTALTQDLFDPPSGLFSEFNEETST